MLTFAELTWKGGGYAGWTATIGQPKIERAKSFTEFEKRLLEQKKQYFKDLAFNYVKQSDLKCFFVLVDNKGYLMLSFSPEKENFSNSEEKPPYQLVGGTLMMKHWWAPLISGVLEKTKENTTWYAETKIWSDENKQEEF